MIGGACYATEMLSLQDALFICYKQTPDNAHSVAFTQCSSSPRLIEDETFIDSDIINNLIDYEDEQEEPGMVNMLFKQEKKLADVYGEEVLSVCLY
ncbi:uncharacterized protein TNCV_2909621 [Trichonephila clavipes]|nr:uncharacterized protein TNCV_2909621 [Trichonephila clavipes]